jgi:hypothetical protein
VDDESEGESSVQSTSGLVDAVGSIDKWFGERTLKSRSNQESVQSAIGSVDTKKSSIDKWFGERKPKTT